MMRNLALYKYRSSGTFVDFILLYKLELED